MTHDVTEPRCMPTDLCLRYCVVLRTVTDFRRWLDKRGKGGPTPGDPGPVLEDRKIVLDRYEQHVKHCTACQKVSIPFVLLSQPLS